MKEHYTTGDVAKICNIAPRTVVNYCEQGKIGSVKSPITNYRRISRAELLKFMKQYDIPRSAINKYECRTVLLADNDPRGWVFSSPFLRRRFRT